MLNSINNLKKHSFLNMKRLNNSFFSKLFLARPYLDIFHFYSF
jgi:hypothetical protein